MPTCNEHRIEQFLLHDLSPFEQQDLEQHLSTCETCCRRLQESTAEQSWWRQVSDFLPDQEHDLQQLTQVFEHTQIDDVAPLSGAIRNVVQLLAPTDDPAMLGRLGGYEVAGVVGAGGMSVVLKAFDRSLNRYVAMKVLAPHLATSGAARMRFAREAQAAAAIVHDNVIAIHGVDEDQGLPYLVMPYVRGDSLQKRLDRDGSLAIEEILRIAKQSAEGLAAAHAQGLVHRDVKPANILLADGVERVTITDFGLARAADDASLTRSGMIAGTPQYMSPEQARGESIDQRSDLFSLGSVVYAMCTGRPPFRSESSYGVLRRISDTQPRSIQEINHQIPDWFCRLVNRLHAKDAKDRYQSATNLAADLEQCLAHVQQPDHEPLPVSLMLPRTSGRNVSLGLLVTVIAFCAVVVFMSPPWRSGSQDREKIDDSSSSLESMPSVITKPERTVNSPDPEEQAMDGFRGVEFLWQDGIETELLETELDLRELEQQLLPLPSNGF